MFAYVNKVSIVHARLLNAVPDKDGEDSSGASM